jgi:ketosteroid isomerase-like protein
VNRDAVDRWLSAYVAAWRSYDPDQIGALITDDVSYRFHPADEPILGRAAVVAAWNGDPAYPDAPGRDEPGTYDASYRAIAVDGDVAVAVGTSTYREAPERPVSETYDNCFVMRFDDEGRCREFTEWYVKRSG